MSLKTLSFRDHDQIRAILGCQDQNLKLIRKRLGVQVVVRGEEIRLTGDDNQVDAGHQVFVEMQTVLARRGELFASEVERILDRHSVMPRTTETLDHSTRSTISYQDAARDNAPANRFPGAPNVPDMPNDGTELSSINMFEKAKVVRAKTEGQDKYVNAIRKNDLVFCTGPAGSGKTYLAVAMALNALRSQQVRKIVLVRPAVEAGEKLGFLPGDMLAKVNPYLRPLLDALADIVSYEQVRRYMEHDVIEIIPLAFMRGRTLNETFMILDEAQNTTTTQMKMFLTRMGEKSKIVVTGDTTQTDLPDNLHSGLKDAIHRLQRIKGVGTVGLTGQDIVRHRLVKEIVKAYDDEAEAKNRQRDR